MRQKAADGELSCAGQVRKPRACLGFPSFSVPFTLLGGLVLPLRHRMHAVTGWNFLSQERQRCSPPRKDWKRAAALALPYPQHADELRVHPSASSSAEGLSCWRMLGEFLVRATFLHSSKASGFLYLFLF